ncbi:hypothetical protein [Sulfurimonas sp.]|uniref:hypothetical protein n=1 Tax=Sulfurimonas sp. TaxID=2022749 RepID=UPI003D0AB78A
MRPFSSINILRENLIQQNAEHEQRKQQLEEQKLKDKIEHEKQVQKLKEKEQEMIHKKIAFLDEEKNNILSRIKECHTPVVISFLGNENAVADKYIQLKKQIQTVEIARDEMKAISLSILQIFLAKLSATLFFIFLLVRLASENTELLENFVFISIAQMLFGESMMTLYIDLVLQDFPLVIAISYIIAISFKSYKNFYLNTTRTKLFIAFGVFIFGMFLSSILFAY